MNIIEPEEIFFFDDRNYGAGGQGVVKKGFFKDKFVAVKKYSLQNRDIYL